MTEQEIVRGDGRGWRVGGVALIFFTKFVRFFFIVRKRHWLGNTPCLQEDAIALNWLCCYISHAGLSLQLSRNYKEILKDLSCSYWQKMQRKGGCNLNSPEGTGWSGQGCVGPRDCFKPSPSQYKLCSFGRSKATFAFGNRTLWLIKENKTSFISHNRSTEGFSKKNLDQNVPSAFLKAKEEGSMEVGSWRVPFTEKGFVMLTDSKQ